MQEQKKSGFLIGGIASAVLCAPLGIIGSVFKIIGYVFATYPEDATISVHGRVLEGEEAVEASLKLGHTMETLGGIFLIATAVFLVLCIVLIVLYRKWNKAVRG